MTDSRMKQLTITELNRLLSLPPNASDMCGFRLDLGDGRQLIVTQWSPSVSNENQVVAIHLDGVIEFKDP